jgi:acyl-CoA hydrolase
MPQCMGGIESAVHISKVSHIIEGSSPALAQLPSAIPSEVDKKVAKLIVEEIPNGACLQLGIGGMPNAVGIMIADSDLKDLGVHTEMYVDAFVEMSLKGKINGSKKSIDRGRQTFAFGAGTEKLYKFIHNNPAVMSTTVEYTNDPRTTVHWVVTEYGKVNLKGMSTWQRAEAIISIANPLFQDNLIREAESLKIWKNSNR